MNDGVGFAADIARSLSYDVAHLAAALALLASFAQLSQSRLASMVNIFALQAAAVAAAAFWEAYAQGSEHLYITAAITVALKVLAVPLALHWLTKRLSLEETQEHPRFVGFFMLLGVGLVALAILLVLPVTAKSAGLTRETLALALSVVLLGLLSMIVRRNAISQVLGFMGLENGLTLAAVGVKGMPMVVEMSIAFSVLVAFILFSLFFVRIRERFETLDAQLLDAFRGERR